MDNTSEQRAARALKVAHEFLGRWRDCATRSSTDDIVQDAVIEAWRRRATLQQPERWDAFVRTLTRRYRCREMIRSRRQSCESLDLCAETGDQFAAPLPAASALNVGGHRVSASWCLEQLPSVLCRLDALNEAIVRSFYEGFSCSEIAARYGVPEDTVKVRLYRCRARIRREFESRVRTARLAGEPCFLFGESDKESK